MDARLDRYADLAVRVGANVAPGQLVDVSGYPAHAPLIRAVARAAYRAGARYVDVRYIDQHVRRAMVELAPEETLRWSPPWLVTKLRELANEQAPRSASSATPSRRTRSWRNFSGACQQSSRRSFSRSRPCLMCRNFLWRK